MNDIQNNKMFVILINIKFSTFTNQGIMEILW